jgi:hypothetical protein
MLLRKDGGWNHLAEQNPRAVQEGVEHTPSSVGVDHESGLAGEKRSGV